MTLYPARMLERAMQINKVITRPMNGIRIDTPRPEDQCTYTCPSMIRRAVPATAALVNSNPEVVAST